MRKTLSRLLITVSMLAGGCAQESIELPEAAASASGACGPRYPGGDGDGGVTYGFGVGDTLPCLLWESVRVGERGEEANTYLSMAELFLQYTQRDKTETGAALASRYGVAEPRSILIAVSAKNCPACEELLPAISAMKDELAAAGTVTIAAAFTDFTDLQAVLSLKEAELVLLGGADAEWREEWHRTNDAEGHLEDKISFFPDIIIVRLEDMKVVDEGRFYDPENLTPLLETVRNIAAQ